MSMFDTQKTFAEIARRAKEIKDAEEAWFAKPPCPSPEVPVAPTAAAPDLEQEWWDEYYNGGGA